MGIKLFLSILILVLTLRGNFSKKLEAVINTDSKWEFITRFCFLSESGGMTYEVRYPKEFGVQRLLFYYDTPGQWSFVYNRGKTCEQKSVVATRVGNYFGLGDTHCTTFNHHDGREWYNCKASLDFHSARERWWYLVLERCADADNPQKTGLYLEYKFHLTNGDDLLHQEFSADQFYILPINIVFFILYVIVLGLSITVALVLRKRSLYHTTYAMFLISVSIWTVSLLFLVIAWGSYGNTGWELSKMEVFGRILQATSNIIFILMLVLMAKGYTIVRGRLTNKASVKITVFIMIYIVATITLFVWEAHVFDEGLVLYYYESPAGYCMIAIQLLGWLWVTKAAVFTLKHHANTTSKFYIPFYIIYTIWFWTAPVTIMLAMFVMPKWMREKTVHGVLQFVAFAGHVTFLFLTRPSKANSNFPYNIKTSQIDVVGGTENEGESDASPRNLYTVSYQTDHGGTGPNLDMFITAKVNNNHHHNGTVGQAGYPSGRMYGPLDMFTLDRMAATSGDSPPPSYPQALADINSDQHVPSTRPYQDPYQSATTSSRLPPIANRLPPIGESASSGQQLHARETTLPPIRGTGLPAFEPTAPQDPADTEEPPDYSKLFQVK